MHPPEFLDAHHDPVLSDHPALLMRAGGLSAKRTFLLQPKRTLSFWDYSRNSLSLSPLLQLEAPCLESGGPAGLLPLGEGSSMTKMMTARARLMTTKSYFCRQNFI